RSTSRRARRSSASTAIRPSRTARARRRPTPTRSRPSWRSGAGRRSTGAGGGGGGIAAAREATPVMLLDDVMSELDRDRRARLVGLLRGRGQSVITTTRLDHVPGGGEPAD